MGHIIINKGDAYNIYSTICDGCLFESALTLEQLKFFIREEAAKKAEEELVSRLERVHQFGTSSRMDSSLEETVDGNHAGPRGGNVPVAKFIEKYLSFAPEEVPK